MSVVLCGPVMAGQRPAAIVSPQPGTTRDVVESTLDIGGYPMVLRYEGGCERW